MSPRTLAVMRRIPSRDRLVGWGIDGGCEGGTPGAGPVTLQASATILLGRVSCLERVMDLFKALGAHKTNYDSQNGETV